MIKIILITGIIIMLVIIGIMIVTYLNTRPLSKKQAISLIQKSLEKRVAKNKTIPNGLLQIESSQLELSQNFTCGLNHGVPIEADQPFHTASIGKIFTSTLVNMLQERNLLNINDPITKYLDNQILQGLFVYKGTDYKDKVTIKQLLNHTSGIADYFEDPVTNGLPMRKLMLKKPDKLWTPLELVKFTKNNQKAVSSPGKKMHYSDTGYILLGLIIESSTGKAFHENLHKMIFEPVGMNNSYLMFYSTPKNPNKKLNELYLESKKIHTYKSLSVDWSGGGIVSTLSDLCKFSRALNKYELVSKETLNNMYTFDQKYRQGMHYGLGVIEYHFEEYFPTLKYLPNVTGHMGVFGTQMFYDKNSDTVIILSLGSTDGTAQSVRLLLDVVSILVRIKYSY
jgi:D-alanyl-D-alanine carboxypeptidase